MDQSSHLFICQNGLRLFRRLQKFFWSIVWEQFQTEKKLQKKTFYSQ